jgi:hypothetical protein
MSSLSRPRERRIARQSFVMTMNRADVRRWIEGFEAAATVDREALRRRGADVPWSIGLALSLIAAAEAAGRLPDDAAREADAEPVRRAWAILHRRPSLDPTI